jgi:serine/threonine protein kinase
MFSEAQMINLILRLIQLFA